MLEDSSTLGYLIGNYVIRKTGEEVEIVAFHKHAEGKRTKRDWVTYIDSKGKEHIREHLNIQLDFKVNTYDKNPFEKLLEFTKNSGVPSIKNQRVFDMAKDLVVNNDYDVDQAIAIAINLVEKVNGKVE